MKKFCCSLAFGCALLTQAWAAPDVTPLQFGVTIERGDVRQAINWLDAGLPPDFVGDRIGTGLMIGAWEGNIPMMEAFLSRGARIDAANKNGEQALLFAAYKGHKAAVEWLLQHGAPVNRQGNEWHPLHYAVFSGRQEIIQLLLQSGADVNARMPNKSTSLMLAAREGHTEIAEQLVKAGADPRLTNDRGDTAATWAAKYGNLSIAKLVSSPEAFANIAMQAPEAPPPRSVEAPTQIDDLLKRIRYAEAQNLPTAGLRKSLMTAVERARLESERNKKLAAQQDAKAVKGLVVTAQRKPNTEGKTLERVEFVYGPSTTQPLTAASPAATPTATAPVITPAAAATDKSGRIETLLEKIRVAKAKGQPTDALRKELAEAVADFSKPNP